MGKMFCFQCQEAAKGVGCSVGGVCGKNYEVANLQDTLIYVLKGISFYSSQTDKLNKELAIFTTKSIFKTVTNTNFDPKSFIDDIFLAFKYREDAKKEFLKEYFEKHRSVFVGEIPKAAEWIVETEEEIKKFSNLQSFSPLSTKNEDVRSLRELLIYGLKGMAAYADHAHVLGFENLDIFRFIFKGLAATLDDNLTADQLVSLVMEAGKYGVDTMALLDKGNRERFGEPEISEVNIGVSNRPGILISGHDLLDMEMLLEQTKDSGIDIYTHSEMLPANYYPKFKKYSHFVGNYGNAWWKQNGEFETFNGPILMTTNCIIPPKKSYIDRIFTTGNVSFPGIKHIKADKNGVKDFSQIIEIAKGCSPPKEIETGKIVGGFAHNQVLSLADKVVDAVKTGAVKRFVVMAGCDGRHKSRSYFTDIAQELPKDTIILTAGCAKYRYNKLNLGDIGGIPRVLDAGQCNDSYSLAVIALKLKEVFNLDDINDLPISYDIAWYEQKAVIVLLALLYLGVKGIRLGPTLPAFLSPNVAKVLVDTFDIKPIGEVKDDIESIMLGK